MPTLDAPTLWRVVPPDDGAVTDNDWPILTTVMLSTETDGPAEQPTRNATFLFAAASDSDSVRIRHVVKKAVAEFGPAFDRLGGE